MGKDTVQAPKHVDQILYRSILIVGIGKGEATGKDLGVGDDVGSPVERMATVVDGAAGARLLVDGAQELPFRCTHFGTCDGATSGCVEKKADNETVALSNEEAAELV